MNVLHVGALAFTFLQKINQKYCATIFEWFSSIQMLYRGQDCTFISHFWMHGKGITGKEVEMAKETRKDTQKEISHAKNGRNHEILGMLKAGVSARQISREYNWSYK